MSDEYDFDYGRAHELLSIVQLVAEVAPAYTSIASEAMAELKEINQDILEAVKARKKAADEEAAAKAAEEADQGEDVLGETNDRYTAEQRAAMSEPMSKPTNTPIRRTI